MAYENISNDKTGSGGTETGGNPGINELVYNVITPMRSFITGFSDNIMPLVTLTFDADTTNNKPGEIISTIRINDASPSDIIWWRGISGTPGKFSNYRMVEDEDKYGNKVGIHFEATWDWEGSPNKPILSIDGHGIIEYVALQNKTEHMPVIKIKE